MNTKKSLSAKRFMNMVWKIREIARGKGPLS